MTIEELRAAVALIPPMPWHYLVEIDGRLEVARLSFAQERKRRKFRWPAIIASPEMLERLRDGIPRSANAPGLLPVLFGIDVYTATEEERLDFYAEIVRDLADELHSPRYPLR